MSTHRLCCCADIVPGSCADLMCIEEHPTTIVMTGLTGVKRWQRTLMNVNDCVNDNCNSTDEESEWARYGEAHHQLNFGVAPIVLRRVGPNCCYVADDVAVAITWSYSQHDYERGCRCFYNGETNQWEPGPLKDYAFDAGGTVMAPGCYRVDCVSGPDIREPFLVHRLSWCMTPAPARVPTYKFSDPLTNELCEDSYQVLYYQGLWIAAQSICWKSPVQDLTTLVYGDYYDENWCNGCMNERTDESCESSFQVVHPCLTKYCRDGFAQGNSHPMPFEISADYDEENPPPPCSTCGIGSTIERCGGVVNMCAGGIYENNDPCYDCAHELTVLPPLYA